MVVLDQMKVEIQNLQDTLKEVTASLDLASDGEDSRPDEVIVDHGGGEGCRRLRRRNELEVGVVHCDCPFCSGVVWGRFAGTFPRNGE